MYVELVPAHDVPLQRLQLRTRRVSDLLVKFRGTLCTIHNMARDSCQNERFFNRG
jgi:hypothetical protein